MSITDHVAILLAGSFDAPKRNKLKSADKPPEYYAVVAFDASAGDEIAAAMAAIAPGGNLAGITHSVKPNARLNKPYPGIPDDALVVRFATQFAPEVYSDSGELVPADTAHAGAIRSQLFAGQRIRINGAPYVWNFQGKAGISWNLYGVMAVGGGERRATASDAFAKYLPAGTDSAAPPPETPAADNPFGAQGAATAAPVTAGNPFQQANAGNPFG